jgi:hypothetical protein
VDHQGKTSYTAGGKVLGDQDTVDGKCAENTADSDKQEITDNLPGRIKDTLRFTAWRHGFSFFFIIEGIGKA